MTTRYADAKASTIITDDGHIVPADPGNIDYQALLASGVGIAPFAPPPPTAADVRAEAARRMQLLVGARDARHLDVIVSNGTREAIRLLRLRAEREWTAEEGTRAAQLQQLDTAIDAIRAASNAMEAEPPADFASDARWPAAG
jgi:hypothetical protein